MAGMLCLWQKYHPTRKRVENSGIDARVLVIGPDLCPCGWQVGLGVVLWHSELVDRLCKDRYLVVSICQCEGEAGPVLQHH